MLLMVGRHPEVLSGGYKKIGTVMIPPKMGISTGSKKPSGESCGKLVLGSQFSLPTHNP
jgi:hypothetical protein